MKKNSRRSRRLRNRPALEKEQKPFFQPVNDTPVQTKPEQAFFQPKRELTIGQPGDKYEQEADQVADAVVNGAGQQPAVQKQEVSGLQRYMTNAKEDELGTNTQRIEKDKAIQEKAEMPQEELQKAAAPEEEMEGQAQMMPEEEIQEMPAAGGEMKEEEPAAVQAQEDKEMVNKQAAPEEEEPALIQGKEDEEMISQQAEPEQKEEAGGTAPLQTKTEGGGSTVAGPKVAQAIDRTKGKGRPLSGKTRGEMENAFGVDFSQVNIHADERSVELNRHLHAQAFTHGRDVYFNAGKFNPETSQGKRLLAHELTHVVQQGQALQRKPTGRPAIQREAETDTSGAYTNNYVFRPSAFFRRVQQMVADGPLTDDEIRSLRTYAIGQNGTILHVELLLMAAMRNTANVALMNSHTSGKLLLAMSAITQADRDYIVNFDRATLSPEIVALQDRRDQAQAGTSNENVDDLNQQLATAADAEIIAAGGSSFQEQALRISTHLMSGSAIPPVDVLTAMYNAASDSTHGDKVMAGTAYIVAREAGHATAGRILNGSLKVDALIPRVYRRIRGGGDASYTYSTDGDIAKADTLYLPTSLNLFDIADRALIIHELTHAEDDAALTGGTQDMNTVDLEMNAYRAQTRYIMDQIRTQPSGSVPGLVNTASALANDDPLFYWAYIAAAKQDTSTYTQVLTEIMTNAPMNKSAGDVNTDLGLSSADIDTRFQAALLNLKGADGSNLYTAGSTTRVDGAAGHFFTP